MNLWNSARYVLAILVIAAFPLSLLLWLAIHPSARRSPGPPDFDFLTPAPGRAILIS